MITSLDNKKVKEWTKLHQKKYRNDTYLLLEEETVKAAYEKGYLKTLVYVGDKPFDFPESYDVTEEVMNKISMSDGLYYIGVATKIKMSDDYKERVLILDELQDPLNIGRIIKNASQFGYDSVILSENAADFYNEKAIEAAGDALYKVNINRTDIKEEILKLKSQGFKVYSTGLWKNTRDLREIKESPKMAFVMGNEGSGVREEIYQVSDDTVKIDMHNIDSLNVAMAAAIVMYRFSK